MADSNPTSHFRHHHCHFPVSRAESPKHQKTLRYLRVPIFSDDESQGKGQPSGVAETQDQTLLSAWAVLLHKYTGSEVVSFAAFYSPESYYGRKPNDTVASEGDRSGAEDGSDGCNGLILRYQVSESARLQDVCQVSREPWTATDLARSGSVNTAIDFSDRLELASCGQEDEQEGKLSSVQLKSRHGDINDYFALVLEANASYSSSSICYRIPKIRQGYATTISRSFRTIIKCLTSDANCFVAHLDLPDNEQKLQMLSWNPSDPFAAQVNACMHDLVSAKADQMPNSEAVCSWEGSLTYLELNRLSSVAAEKLQSAGVGPGVYVPFAHEKSIWAVVAILAILKAGGAFVPLNPQDPSARLEQIVQGVGARVIVASERFMGLFETVVKKVVVISKETIQSRDLVCLNGHSETLTTTVRSAWPEDPIFVLFTSGSTGTAKGMIHTHRSSCTHALSHGRAMGYHGARVLQFAAYTFDVAIFDIFTTLIFGGCVCVPSEEDRRNGIVDVIRSLRADYAILTPSFAGVIDPAEVPTLKTVAVGGEALPQERIQRFAQKVRLTQIYGPAEVGICITMEMQIGTRPETVGRPLDNSSCWLVDLNDSDRLVPIGTVGELVVAGPSLAQGYLNDTARTARSFIAAPAWAQQMGLRYGKFHKTGDLLRYNLDALDGTLDFIGRKDAQIKLRGQRIEPGEIEYHIGHLPGVTVCMVTRPEYGCFAGELIAVVQLQDENGDCLTRVRDEPLYLSQVQSLQVEVLREHLEKVLPGYMIPNACLVVTCLPFVPSLKVDRKRVEKWLIDMETRPTATPQSQFAPLDRSEETALSLSIKVSEYIALKDRKHSLRLQGHDFRLQDVGIDSIHIISLSLFLQKEYAVKVPMRILLSSRLTIRDLSRLIDAPSPPWINGQTSHSSQELTRLDISKEAALLTRALFDEVGPQPRNISSGPHIPIRNVLVTGATGYLGTAIMHRLLAVPTIHVYALVRCTDTASGFQRLRDAIAPQGRWQEPFAARIHVWKGDITQPNLGLGQQQELRQLLGHDVSADDAIHALVHSAARVHYSSDYDALKGANVTATLSALRLAALAARLTSFVFVSGGVAPSPRNCSMMDDDDTARHLRDDDNASGYTQTKLVAEAIVRRCMMQQKQQPHSNGCGGGGDGRQQQQNSPWNRTAIRIVKPGYIIGSRSHGIANTSDFIWRLVAGCVEIGAYSRDDAEKWLYVADVDTVAGYVVQGIVDVDGGRQQQDDDGAGNGTLVSGGNAEEEKHEEKPIKNATVRVPTRLRLSTLWHILRTTHDYPLSPLPQTEWLSRLRSRIFEVGESHLLFPLLHILERDGGSVGEEEEETGLMVDGNGSGNGSGEVEDAVKKNIDYLIRMGFLPRAG